jgi:hypothetical protein
MMDDAFVQRLVALERRLLDPTTRRDPGAVTALLANSFVEFGSSGRVYTKSEIVAELSAETQQEVEAFDFATRELAPGVVQVTYGSRRNGDETLRSSIWLNGDKGWQIVFHQGTKVPPT